MNLGLLTIRLANDVAYALHQALHSRASTCRTVHLTMQVARKVKRSMVRKCC